MRQNYTTDTVKNPGTKSNPTVLYTHDKSKEKKRKNTHALRQTSSGEIYPMTTANANRKCTMGKIDQGKKNTAKKCDN
jgi:hypothetical protein